MSQTETAPRKRRPGRPPSEASRQRVLATAYQILMDEGLGRLSIERVAAEAGVSKPTIYRSWSNAQELAMAAFMEEPLAAKAPRETGSVRSVLRNHLKSVIDSFATKRGRQITLTMASADPDSELAKAFRNQVILKSRSTGRRIIEQALAAGDVRADIDVDTVLDMLYGPVFFRLLAGHQPITASLAAKLVDGLFDGIASVPDS